jgi:hypothetical protein
MDSRTPDEPDSDITVPRSMNAVQRRTLSLQHEILQRLAESAGDKETATYHQERGVPR